MGQVAIEWPGHSITMRQYDSGLDYIYIYDSETYDSGTVDAVYKTVGDNSNIIC